MKSFDKYNVAQEHVGLTVEHYLKQILQYSGRNIQKLTRQKGILLNGKPAYLQKKIKLRDTVQILAPQDNSYGVQTEEGTITILYEDNHLVVLNKPAHQLVHPAGHTASGTLANFWAFHLRQRGIITTVRPLHRLDRETSGCVIFAKDARSQSLLEQQLKSGILKRTYQALTKGIISPPAGTINAPLGTHPSLSNRRAVTEQGKQAITNYRTVRNFPDTTLVELMLDTGRTHQIRVHLAHIGHPIIGDGMYGVRASWMTRQALHATAVSFQSLHDNSTITVHAPLPADFAQALDYCAKSDTIKHDL